MKTHLFHIAFALILIGMICLIFVAFNPYSQSFDTIRSIGAYCFGSGVGLALSPLFPRNL